MWHKTNISQYVLTVFTSISGILLEIAGNCWFQDKDINVTGRSWYLESLCTFLGHWENNLCLHTESISTLDKELFLTTTFIFWQFNHSYVLEAVLILKHKCFTKEKRYLSIIQHKFYSSNHGDFIAKPSSYFRFVSFV